jgi:hypothetical protein
MQVQCVRQLSYRIDPDGAPRRQKKMHGWARDPSEIGQLVQAHTLGFGQRPNVCREQLPEIGGGHASEPYCRRSACRLGLPSRPMPRPKSAAYVSLGFELLELESGLLGIASLLDDLRNGGELTTVSGRQRCSAALSLTRVMAARVRLAHRVIRGAAPTLELLTPGNVTGRARPGDDPDVRLILTARPSRRRTRRGDRGD